MRRRQALRSLWRYWDVPAQAFAKVLAQVEKVSGTARQEEARYRREGPQKRMLELWR